MKLPCQWPCKEWQSFFPTVTPPAGEDIESIEVHAVLFSYNPRYKDVIMKSGVACENAIPLSFSSLFASNEVIYNGTEIPLKNSVDLSHLLVAELEDKAVWPECPPEGFMARMMKCEGDIKLYGLSGLYFDEMRFVYNPADDTMRYYCNEASKENQFFVDTRAFRAVNNSPEAEDREFFSTLTSIFASPFEEEREGVGLVYSSEVF